MDSGWISPFATKQNFSMYLYDPSSNFILFYTQSTLICFFFLNPALILMVFFHLYCRLYVAARNQQTNKISDIFRIDKIKIFFLYSKLTTCLNCYATMCVKQRKSDEFPEYLSSSRPWTIFRQTKRTFDNTASDAQK